MEKQSLHIFCGSPSLGEIYKYFKTIKTKPNLYISNFTFKSFYIKTYFNITNKINLYKIHDINTKKPLTIFDAKPIIISSTIVIVIERNTHRCAIKQQIKMQCRNFHKLHVMKFYKVCNRTYIDTCKLWLRLTCNFQLKNSKRI